MQEFRSLAIDTIHESENNPRRVFADVPLQELADSVREHGVIQPLVVTQNGDGYVVLAGARRLRAAKLVGLANVPVRIVKGDSQKTSAIALIENIHRKDLDALDEATAYRRMLDQNEGLTLDGLSAIVLKPKRHIHEQLRLLDLIPEAQDLLAKDVLPIEYARLLARAPQEKQVEGLSRCFRPLFSSDGPQRDYLEPLANLKDWFERAVRLEPRSEDTKILMPEVHEHVEQVETEQKARVVMLSTLHNHHQADRDRADKPILQRSWKFAEGDDACKYAQPGLVVIGPQKGERFNVCINKVRCTKHWGDPTTPTVAEGAIGGTSAIGEERRARLEAEEKRRAEAQRWEEELWPRALRLLAARTAHAEWTPELLEKVLDRVTTTSLCGDLLPPLNDLPVAQYPQAVILHLASEDSWRWDSLSRLLKSLGVRLTSKEIERPEKEALGNSERGAHSETKPKARQRRSKKTARRRKTA